LNREFLLNAVFLVLVNLLIKPFYVFGIERTVQERVGTEQYGLYATLFSFAYLLFMVNDFGIHYFNSRTVARHPQLAAKLFPNTLIGIGVFSSLGQGFRAGDLGAAAVRGAEPRTGFHGSLASLQRERAGHVPDGQLPLHFR
jgi:drug/metabolite transporter (DMT)-like permease